MGGSDINVISKAITILFVQSVAERLNQCTYELIIGQDVNHNIVQVLSLEPLERCPLIKQVLDLKGQIEGKYVLFVYAGDYFSKDYFKQVILYMDRCNRKTDVSIGMVRKYYKQGEKTILDRACQRKYASSLLNGIISLEDEYGCFPYYLEGTVFSSEAFRNTIWDDYGTETEKVFLIRFLLKHRQIAYIGTQKYIYHKPKDWNVYDYPEIYEYRWYYGTMFETIPNLLEQCIKKKGELPQFVQYLIMHLVLCRFDASFNNYNKYIVPADECFSYIKEYEKVFHYIDDDVILNIYGSSIYNPNANLKAIFIHIKRKSQVLDYMMSPNNITVGVSPYIISSVQDQKVNIQFINYIDSALEIDGTISNLFSHECFEYYVLVNDKKLPFVFNELYSHTKYFGKPIYKRQAFHVSIPMKYISENDILVFIIQRGNVKEQLGLTYDSHTSRLTNRFNNSYWLCDKYMVERASNGIRISMKSKRKSICKEMRLLKEMCRSKKAGKYKFILYRLAYHVSGPFYRKKEIWFFMDKIYKGGDSSEYLYRYSMKQKDGIKKYYLLDKKCADFKRLRKMGYRPIKRGSIRHRLTFLYADMVIASNSTVFAFNNFYLDSSIFIKDLVDFHVVCVQHGLSVQKIAIAQNRLRDNTRLYFCASKYEIENLSKPVYGYSGYDAIKLTGVPRYDGLISDDKKQILISPTWRMQSARPVTVNEGVERDYNQEFKKTSYYKVYNSLVNDERLLKAALKYGYRIVYVLHPIVSPQVNDFDKNEYVDIIPATSNMSYEKIFCESSLMVTDYSGVQFDFAYMKKPLVYLHHKDIPQHYEEGTYHYDTMAFGEIARDNEELISYLCEYMKNGCVLKDKYRQRVEDFYAYNDQNNCQRIYDEMINYQISNISK